MAIIKKIVRKITGKTCDKCKHQISYFTQKQFGECLRLYRGNEEEWERNLPYLQRRWEIERMIGKNHCLSCYLSIYPKGFESREEDEQNESTT
jgi:hypothetical protein